MLVRRIPKRPLLVVAALVLVVPACKQMQSTPTQPGGGGGAPVAAAQVTASAANTFSPRIVNLILGGTVTFSNAGGRHNVNANGAANFKCATSCQGAGGAPTEDTWSFTITFDTAGTVNFVCDEHAGEGMNGQINVQ